MAKIWNNSNLKSPHCLVDKAQRVERMFSAIAGSYDRANHLLSLNMDHRWRRRAVELAQMQAGQSVLDLCCGTGDLAFEFARQCPALKRIVGVDLSRPMLDRAQQKHNARQNAYENCDNYHVIEWLNDDVEKLSFADDQFDCVSCAFGIRNLQNVSAGLLEAYRLLKPGGRLVILEFDMPPNPILSWAYQCYFRLVMPFLGGMIAQDKNGAYRYLSSSVRSFRAADFLTGQIQQVGFEGLKVEKLFLGAVLAFVAHK